MLLNVASKGTGAASRSGTKAGGWWARDCGDAGDGDAADTLEVAIGPRAIAAVGDGTTRLQRRRMPMCPLLPPAGCRGRITPLVPELGQLSMARTLRGYACPAPAPELGSVPSGLRV